MFTVAGSYKNMESDSVNSVQSSLKNHSLWVTLYVRDSLALEGEMLHPSL